MSRLRLRRARSILYATLASYGWRGIARRSRYEVRRRFGLLRRDESICRRSGPITAAWRIPVPTELPPPSLGEHDPVTLCDEILGGKQRLYGGVARLVCWPPRWHVNPYTLMELPRSVHWTELSDTCPGGDIKDVWELSRFGFVGPLVRAWARTGDDRYPEAFWTAVEDWVDANTAFDGPNWMCGQETSLRAMSVLFGLGAFADHRSTTPDRRAVLAQLVSASVDRVEPTIGYAMSQRNNHAISEACFLFSSMCVLPGHPDRARLLRTSTRALEEALADQVYDDGSHAQFSPTYQRLAVHALFFVDLVSRITEVSLPDGVEEALQASSSFLRRCADWESGWLPNAGGNDGALLFDLAPCHIRDFRPVIAALAARTGHTTPFPPGPWDEEARWFGYQPSSQEISDLPLGEGAYRVLRGERSHAVLRAGARRHRPAHADMLHVDLWMEGVNVALDPGTYRYSAPPPWSNALADQDVHNVPTVPSESQGVRIGRFFWTDWHDAEVLDTPTSELGPVVAARLVLGHVVLHRLVGRVGRCWVVLDQASTGPLSVRWNLPAGTQIDGQMATGAVFSARFGGGPTEVSEADPEIPSSGWSSPTYGELEPCTALKVVADDGWATAWFAPTGQQLPPTQQEQSWWTILHRASGTSESL